MAYDLTLKLDSFDLSPRLLSFKEVMSEEGSEIITTLDGTDHYYNANSRSIIYFNLLPATAEEDYSLYQILNKRNFSVTYSRFGKTRTKNMHLVGNPEIKFLLKSADGKIRYGGGTFELKAIERGW